MPGCAQVELSHAERLGFGFMDEDRATGVSDMEPTERGERWDGWDDPDYQPTPAELNEPVAIDCDDPDELARAVMAFPPSKPRR